jgi:NAD(P)-dependent dehydrogenase (short-subunit alcohol dehydrogenase family)
MSLTEPGKTQVVLISGGASGIGRCIAEAFFGEGCAVHVCDASAHNIEGFLAANPGATATLADVGSAERGISSDDVRENYVRYASMRTFVSPEDIANMAMFLASDAATKFSGQAIAVDGHTEGLSNWLD